MRAGVLAQRIERPGADPARRQIHDPLERGVVAAARAQPQVGERILDFGALEESQAAVYLVGQPRVQERFFEYARLRIRTIQDRDIAPQPALVHPFADAVDDEIGLVAFVEGRVEADALAVLAAGPQRLAEPAGIVRDQRIRGLEYRAGRAVVLFQFVERRRGKVALELVQVLDPRAAPAVDRLIVVADRERQTGGAGEQHEPFVLDGVRVLEFVDEHVPEALAVVVQQRRVVAPYFVGAQQQLGEIHDAGAPAGLLVGLIDPDQLAPRRIAVVLQMLGRAGPRPSAR